MAAHCGARSQESGPERSTRRRSKRLPNLKDNYFTVFFGKVVASSPVALKKCANLLIFHATQRNSVLAYTLGGLIKLNFRAHGSETVVGPQPDAKPNYGVRKQQLASTLSTSLHLMREEIDECSHL